MIKNISNLGDAALYCDFGAEVNKETNSNVIKYFRNLKKKEIQEITNLTPSYNKLIISFDLQKTNFKEIKKKIENSGLNTDFKMIGRFETRRVRFGNPDCISNARFRVPTMLEWWFLVVRTGIVEPTGPIILQSYLHLSTWLVQPA